MKIKYPMVTVKTITDYHLESFLRCPYQFYYQHILSAESNQMKWRQVVQWVINGVVYKFHQLPHTAQNKVEVLKLIDLKWNKVSPQLFDSKVHYYTVLAKTTDYLLQSLTGKKDQQPPLYLYKKINAYIAELEANLSLTFEVAEWTTQSFTVKKFLVEADKEMIQLYQHLITVLSQKAFGKLPEKIETISLLDGKKYTYSPTVENVTQGIMYLNNMKSLLQRTNDYSKTNSLKECESCPYVQKCKDNPMNMNERYRQNDDFVH